MRNIPRANILTLSSHEPFEVPYTSDFSHPYLNSVAYTDSCLGAFVASLKENPLWDSTIVILSPDHGYPYPNGVTRYDPLRYRIPMAIIGGAVKRPYIGISMLDITNSYYLWQAGVTLPKNVKEGVAVIEVVSSSPAAKAGLQKGDIITKLEGTKVGTVAKLRYELYKHTPGDKIDVTYNRDGKEYTTQIKLEEAK